MTTFDRTHLPANREAPQLSPDSDVTRLMDVRSEKCLEESSSHAAAKKEDETFTTGFRRGGVWRTEPCAAKGAADFTTGRRDCFCRLLLVSSIGCAVVDEESTQCIIETGARARGHERGEKMEFARDAGAGISAAAAISIRVCTTVESRRVSADLFFRCRKRGSSAAPRHPMKPRLRVLKLARLGKTVFMEESGTPNQLASVAPY